MNLAVLNNAPITAAWFGFYKRTEEIAGRCDFKRERSYALEVGVTAVQESEGRVYVQVLCDRPDTFTGEFGTGRGGRRYLSSSMTDSEIVRTIFGAFLAYEEHEVRESFTYRDKRIYGPHIDVEALVEIADRIENR